MFKLKQSFGVLGTVGSLLFAAAQPAHSQAISMQVDAEPGTRIPTFREDLPTPSKSVQHWLAQSVDPTQPQTPVQITGVRLNPTPAGLEIFLETREGQILQPNLSSEGDRLIADIPNAVLALPDPNPFQANAPAAGIKSIRVMQQDATTIRIVVAGVETAPTATAKPSDRGLILSLTPGGEDELVVEGNDKPTGTSPTYSVSAQQIEKQGSRTVTEILKSTPGFAINDTGFGADIHTGFYYRGTSINQNTFLLDGRPIGSNVNLYHGATDLNSLLTGNLERIEVSSGTASTLYGSEGFGGVVNIITKEETEPIKANAKVLVGSYGQENFGAGVAGAVEPFSYALGIEHSQAENNYPVPIGAANRGLDGRLVNGDTEFTNYSGKLAYRVDSKNTLKLDAFVNSSRKGLIYFGFPFQRDRLDHDGTNIGLSWKSLLSGNEDSVLTATLGYNRDYFSTYGPTQNIYSRQGTLDSQGLTARVEHRWKVLPFYSVHYGLDLRGEFLNGETFSTAPNRIALNEVENRDRTNTALFVLNTFKFWDQLKVELGLRQNFNSQFDSSAHPSAGIRWDITPKIALRGSWVSVRRNPGLDQLYLFDTVHGWLPNPDLKPERGSAWTTGVDLAITPKISAQFTYFGNRLVDRLSVVSGRWSNVGLVNTNGLEASVRWQILPQLSFLANYTYTDARIETGAEKGQQLSTVPFSVGQVGISYENKGWQANLYGNYNSGSRRALFTTAGTDPLSFSPAWFNLDFNARIPVHKNVGLLLYVENLADVSYEKVNRIYQPGITFRVGVSANY